MASDGRSHRPLPPGAGRRDPGDRQGCRGRCRVRVRRRRRRRARPRACPRRARRSSAALVAEARGAADSLALRLRHHDAALHAAAAPARQRGARGVRRARDRRGSRRWARATGAGSAHNLDRLAEARVRGDAITRARNAEEVPLATAVGLLARQRLTGKAPPEPRPARARAGRRDGSRTRPAAELDSLALTIDDQAAFAKLARTLARGPRPRRSATRTSRASDEGGDDDRSDQPGADEGDEGEEGTPSGGDMDVRGEQSDDEQRRRGLGRGHGSRARSECRRRRRRATAWSPRPAGPIGSTSPPTNYKAFTTRFDETVEASELCDEEELSRLRAYLDQQIGGLAVGRHPARQPAPAAAAGAAGAELGLRPGRRACSTPRGWRGSSSIRPIR